MTDFKALLKKEILTGKELGALDLADVSLRARRGAGQGETPEPLFTREEFNEKLDALYKEGDPVQIAIYQGYADFHDWLARHVGLAGTHFQQAQLAFRTIYEYTLETIMAEEAEKFERLSPVVMTPEEYRETLDTYHRDYREETLLGLLDYWIDYQKRQMEKHPRKKNPLKEVRALYKKARVERDSLRAAYISTGEAGFYCTPAGERSDRMSGKAWAALVERKTEDRTAGEISFSHYEEAPQKLSKWDVAGEALFSLMSPAPQLDTLRGEFPELLEAARPYFLDTLGIDLREEQDAERAVPVAFLRERDFCGMRADLMGAMSHTERAELAAGVAVLEYPGGYSPRQLPDLIKALSLRCCVETPEKWETRRQIIETARTNFLTSYHFIQRFNLIISLTAELHDAECIKVFTQDLDTLNSQVDAINKAGGLLFRLAYNFPDGLNPQKKEKLETVNQVFPPLHPEPPEIPAELMEVLRGNVETFSLFYGEGERWLESFMCK